MVRVRSLFVLPLVLACAPEPPERPPPEGLVVAIEPEAALDAVPSVLRFRIAALSAPPAAVLVFEGALSSYHEGRIRDADLPATLAERFVPATSFRDDSDGAVVVAPARRLREGGTYTLAALGRGALVSVTVASPGPVPYAERLFPKEAASGGTRWVFCGASLPARREVELAPGAVPAVVTPGIADGVVTAEPCFRVDVLGEAPGPLIPPAVIDGVALEPAPISVGASLGEFVARDCVEGEVPLGPGCATVLDDRVVVQSPDVPLVWALQAGESTTVVATEANARFVARGLEPGRAIPFRGVVADARGGEHPFARTVTALAPQLHVVVNEVLANPNGQEPAQEWVELLNDGRSSISLAGFTLGDADDESELPAATLPPGAFALVVPGAFDVRDHLDVPAAEGTLLLRVPRLGQSGLSNSGERVTLRGPDGAVLSSFPPIAATAAGSSIARRSPFTLDDDTRGFLPSDGAGASPGAPNETPP